MDSINKSKGEQRNLNQIKTGCSISNINSKYILKQLFNYAQKNIMLKMIKYNKQLQKNLDISIKDYEKYYKIEIELIPAKHIYGTFINISKQEYEPYFHIYFNDNPNRIRRYYFNKKDKVIKIRIIIDYSVKSFNELFYNCSSIESINFINFERNNIINMSRLFCGCSSLKELNLTNFNTYKVTDMSGMFFGCSFLKELNLTNFNTENVTDMRSMFWGCSSLKILNINNFNTKNVFDMNGMFRECSTLMEIDISNFNTINVTDISYMFCGCKSLKELKMNSLETNNKINMNDMFLGCTKKFQTKMKCEFKNLKKEAF